MNNVHFVMMTRYAEEKGKHHPSDHAHVEWEQVNLNQSHTYSDDVWMVLYQNDWKDYAGLVAVLDGKKYLLVHQEHITQELPEFFSIEPEKQREWLEEKIEGNIENHPCELLELEEKWLSSQSLWMNVYDVYQVYGGPQEGGWYTDLWKCVESLLVPYRDLYAVEEVWKGKYQNSGNIHSVRGGTKYAIYAECSPAESEILTVPQWE